MWNFVLPMMAGFAIDKLAGGEGWKGAALGAGASFLPGLLAPEALGTAEVLTPALTSGVEAAATTEAVNAAATSAFPTLLSPSGGVGAATTGLGTLSTVANPMAGMSPSAGVGAATTGLGTLSTVANPMAGMSPSAGVGAATTGFGSVNPLTTGFSETISPWTQLGNATGGLPSVQSTAGTGLLGRPGEIFGDYLGQGMDYLNSGWDDMSTGDKVTTAGMAGQTLLTPQERMIAPPPPPLEKRNPVPTTGKPLVSQVQGLQQVAPSAMMNQLSPEDKLRYQSLLSSI
tara:strand:- start:4306 stop:5166 length:861 start_codon:yes stop_codon:yes gene_type:complete